MQNKYFILAKYKSKYGLILYCIKVSSDVKDFCPDMNDVYISTLYLKANVAIEVGSVVDLTVIKGDNGLNYCFPA